MTHSDSGGEEEGNESERVGGTSSLEDCCTYRRVRTHLTPSFENPVVCPIQLHGKYDKECRRAQLR
jgi:hypothetical protein